MNVIGHFMETTKYKYDVAFSFCKEDEQLVQILNERIGDRVKTFFYPRQQSELVGLDGEEKFNKIFSKQARLIVVIYRKKYGTTSWTRVEETAIKNRALIEGYDFTIYIPVETDRNTPNYLPKSRIWYDYNRFGTEGLCAIIEKRVTDLDGQILSENSEFKAKRLKRKLDHKKRLNDYFNSYLKEYITDAGLEFKSLKENVKQKLINLADIFADNFKQEDSETAYIFRYKEFQIELIWKSSAYAEDDIPQIHFRLIRFYESSDPFGKPSFNVVKDWKYKFYKDIVWDNIWLPIDTKLEVDIKSDILAEEKCSHFIEFINDPDSLADKTNHWS